VATEWGDKAILADADADRQYPVSCHVRLCGNQVARCRVLQTDSVCRVPQSQINQLLVKHASRIMCRLWAEHKPDSGCGVNVCSEQ
jgi:hypothetical protein